MNIGRANTELSAGRLGLADPNWAANRFAGWTMSMERGSHAVLRSFSSKLKHKPSERQERCRLELGSR